MSAAPPAYNAADAPPTYREAVVKLNRLLGETKSPSEAIRAARNLSEDELLLIAKYSDPEPLRRDEQKKKFNVGVKQTISSSHEVPDEVLKQSATKVANAVVNIDTLFTTLHVRLTGIDDLYKPPDGGFAKKLEAPRQKYRDILRESKDLATEIAVHGEAFDEEVVKMCADRRLSVERRKEAINKWIQDATTYAERLERQTKYFQRLKDEIHEVFVHYSTWAEPRFRDIEQNVKDLAQEIKDLDSEIDLLMDLLALAGAGAFAGFLGAATLGPLFGPVAIVGGLIVAGVSLVAGLGILIALEIKKSRRYDLGNKKKGLEEEKKTLQSVRDQLRDMAEGKDSDIASLNTNVTVLEGFWTHARHDAIEIQDWLHKGADDADLPDYMEQNLNHGVIVYKRMAVHFRQYADSTSIPTAND